MKRKIDLLVICNRRGQMAIFVALIFQVLFVLFAMVINIGMLVHDKINLQNSVDLAAYYAAQKQAEMLNAIAHQNYQIRQAWKLLAFRYWVVGSVANENHPSQSATGGGLANPFSDQAYSIILGDGSLARAPSICAISSFWGDMPAHDTKLNLCKQNTLDIKLATPPVPFIGALNGIVSALFKQSNLSIGAECETYGAFDWMIAMQVYYSFRQDQANRRWVIRHLADQLSQNSSDFLDIAGQSVFSGVRKVVEKNLTSSNREGDLSVSMYNSLAFAQNREAWLQDILVWPMMSYTDSTVCQPGGIRFESRPTNMLPTYAQSAASLQPYIPYAAGQEPSDTRDLMFSSVGVEKNPWAMAYVAVKATSRPRKPFSPFGPSVTLTARAFAKPFGGRIGPWYGASWPRGNIMSVGATEDTKIDALLPARANTGLGSYNPFKNLPNFSRYPGDRLGMNSYLSLRMLFHGMLANGGGGIGRGALMLAWYQHLVDPLGEPVNGSSSRDALAAPGTWVRNAELAAISPDLFDITYYSIEPNYDGNYLKSLAAGAGLGIGGSSGVRGDLGSRQDSKSGLGTFAVKDQISKGKSYLGNLATHYFYKVFDVDHLLTGWNAPTATDYSMPSTFGKCIAKPIKSVDNPGDCVAGSRVGYSVKLVSRGYLLGDRHDYGNDGSNDTILNPPPEDF